MYFYNKNMIQLVQDDYIIINQKNLENFDKVKIDTIYSVYMPVTKQIINLIK